MKKKAVSLVMALMLLIGLATFFTPLSTSAATPDLNRLACYTFAEGNIARSASAPNMLQYSHENDYYVAGNPGTGISRTGVNAQFSNGSKNRILTMNDGTKNQAAGTAWNNWSSAYGVESNPVYVLYNFGQPYVIDSMRVEFTSDGNGYSSGTQVPRQAFIEYWDGSAWVRATDISRPDGDQHGGPIATTGAEAANFVNDAHISGNGSIALANRPNWNKVVFNAPIVASMIRLHLNQRQTANNTNGIGVSEWEVFGERAVLSDEESIRYDVDGLTIPSMVKANFSLPLVGLNGSNVAWESNNAAIVPTGDTAVVTTPSSGMVGVTMTATISKGSATPVTKTFTVTVLPATAPPYLMNINTTNFGIDIAETLYGIFFEDINHSLDGGFNAQMIDNGSFQQYMWMDTVSDTKRGPANGNYSRSATTVPSWRGIGKSSAAGSYTTVSTNPLTEIDVLPGRNANTYQPDYNIAVTVATAPTGTAETRGYGIAASGYGNTAYYDNGTPELVLRDGWNYNVSLYLRGNYNGKVRVFLESSNGTLRSNVLVLDGLTTEWKQFKDVLQATASVTDARLCIVGDAEGTFNVDFVEMRAEDSKLWKNGIAGGLREDMGKALEDLNPKFMRFPGGCASEGMSESRQYFWKDGIYKDLKDRRGMPNYWGYWNSNNIGFYEYFCIAEALGAEPVPVISFGVTCQFHNGTRYDAPIGTPTQLQAYKDLYVKDALDLIEFANGDAETTVWGKIRAEMGHPEPFNLKMVALGNENGGSSTNSAFWQRFRICWDEIKAVYPDIEVVTNSDYLSSGSLFDRNYQVIDEQYPDTIVDEHYYMGNSFFLDNNNRYDPGMVRGGQGNTYDRSKGTRVFVGEYANNSSNNRMDSAVAEAAYTTGLERNSDMVLMACYAPLFCKNAPSPNNWTSNLIWFNNSGVWRTTNYYYQKIFSNNVGNKWLNGVGDNRRTPVLNTSTGATDPTLWTAPSIDTETGTIYCKLVNSSATAAKQVGIELDNSGIQKYKATWEYITGASSAQNQTSQPNFTEVVQPIQVDLGIVRGSLELSLPINCVGALVLTPVDSEEPFDVEGTLVDGKADVTVYNYQTESMPLKVIVATYDEVGRLVEINHEEIVVPPNGKLNVKPGVTKAATAKLFVWESDTYKPLIPAIIE